MKEIRWSQWSQNGMVRCGVKDIKTLMEWMREIGKDAKNYQKYHTESHAVYGRKIYGEDGELAEVRFYQDVYMNDDELGETVMKNPHDVFYVVHRDGSFN